MLTLTVSPSFAYISALALPTPLQLGSKWLYAITIPSLEFRPRGNHRDWKKSFQGNIDVIDTLKIE